MQFKDDEIRRRWIGAHLHVKLGPLLADADKVYTSLYGKEMVLTCVNRTRQETAALYAPNPPPPLPSPHETDPLQAVDARSSVLTEEENQEFADTMNKRWSYDASRPNKKCVLYHEVGVKLDEKTKLPIPGSGSGKHLHLQVCNFTRRVPMEPQKPQQQKGQAG